MKRQAGRLGTLMWLVLAAAGVHAQPTQTVGAGAVLLAPRSGDKAPPAAPMRTAEMLQKAAPTSQWYSTLIFNPRPDPIYAQPLSVRTTPAGLEVALPSKQVVPTERPGPEIHYPHIAALTVSPVAFTPEAAKLARVSDWSIDIAMARGADQLLATVAHGSPYVHFQLSTGDVRVRLLEAAERQPAGDDARLLKLRVKGQTYVLFGPSGVRWEQASPTEWLGRMPPGKGYFSVTGLPADTPQALALLTRHAYAFVRDTRASWRYGAATGAIEVNHSVTTQQMEGPDNGPLLALYPHHWHDNAAIASALLPGYDTVRGPLKLLEAASFKTVRQQPGFVPHWPALTEGPRLADFNDQYKRDLRRRRDLLPVKENPDNWRVSVYWQGKGLTRLTQLMAVAEQQGDAAGRDQLLALAKERMEFWFGGKGKVSYFHLDKTLGTVVAYPDEFFSVEQMNDHHFHYGYWVRAAAEIALRDPAWAAKDKWGAMVDLLVADIATAERGRADFPYLRNFDTYEGHSWAVGIGGAGEYGALGNNQESSSEAVNAWAGLVLWGEVTGNTALRDLGLYLYTTEIAAIDHYWFDLHGLVFPPEYKNVETSMVFGGKYAHNTWWTDEPRQIHGINLLPIAPYSTYLGRSPAFIARNLAAMNSESEAYQKRGKFPANPPPADVWQDIFAKYLALADPTAALAAWNPRGSVEDGDTPTHTLHWMLSLQALGTPDFSVHADTPLHQVFKRPDGTRSYLAFNAGNQPLLVHFSDGRQLTVAPHSLGRAP